MLLLLAALTFWLNRLIQGDKPRAPQRHDPDYMGRTLRGAPFQCPGQAAAHAGRREAGAFSGRRHDPREFRTPSPYHQLPPTEVSARMAYVGADGKEIDLLDAGPRDCATPPRAMPRVTHGARHARLKSFPTRSAD
jgi:hypothetical protein